MERYREVLKKVITEGYRRNDLLFFPRLDLKSDMDEIKIISSYFIKKGHRVFCFSISDKNNNSIEDISDKLKIVNLNTEKLSYIDEIINENIIKDGMLFVRDPRWFKQANYLKTKYNFKIIYNCLDEFLVYDNIYDIIKASEVVITFSQASLEKVKQGNSKAIMINRDDLPRYVRGVSGFIHGLVSIVIITFNNLDYTKRCISSILQKTAYPNYEITIVDNNSTDETNKYLLDLQEKYNNIRVIFNKENYGFAKANNIGIRNSKGKYIILLNNDTIVTCGWITGLIKHLERDERLGQIGPVTNNIFSASQINVPFKDIKDMDYFAHEYTIANLNNLYTDIDIIAMFCAAMRKQVMDEIGELDERFGLGLMEDDDYTNRMIEQGYKIACADDVFIYHYGSASFKKVNHEELVKVHRRNESLYKEKWKRPHIGHKMRPGVEFKI